MKTMFFNFLMNFFLNFMIVFTGVNNEEKFIKQIVNQNYINGLQMSQQCINVVKHHRNKWHRQWLSFEVPKPTWQSRCFAQGFYKLFSSRTNLPRCLGQSLT